MNGRTDCWHIDEIKRVKACCRWKEILVKCIHITITLYRFSEDHPIISSCECICTQKCIATLTLWFDIIIDWSKFQFQIDLYGNTLFELRFFSKRIRPQKSIDELIQMKWVGNCCVLLLVLHNLIITTSNQYTELFWLFSGFAALINCSAKIL